MKILSVFGTRPEAIKMAPLVKALVGKSGIEAKVCVTAQHRQMLDQVLDLFAITPDFDLDLMKAGQTLEDLTAGVLCGMRDVFACWRPDMVFVHGDTTTAYAASIAAYYAKIPVGHVEAGLRTGDKYAPWPEEMNRRIIDAVADLYFAPTERAKENLLREGIAEHCIFVTGNTGIDALLAINARIADDAQLCNELSKMFPFLNSTKKMILVTGHRRENFGVGFEDICHALKEIAHRNDVQIVYPVHMNPNVRNIVHSLLGNIANIFLIEPLDYTHFVYAMRESTLILTDSGGIQEEAPALGKPVLVMRDITERPEAIEAGTGLLVGTDKDVIAKEVSRLLDEPAAYATMAMAHNPYGDGTATERIIESSLNYEVR